MKILYIEDYKLLRESVALGIRDKGWLAETAADGEEGLWMATENEYDAVILDVMLPKVNGLDILATLRKKQNDVPVIMLSAKDDLADRVRGLDLGADDYMVKPFYIDELISRLNAIFRRRSQSRSPVICCGDIEINTVSKEVTRAGDVIPLTSREYALLEYFSHRIGEVVTRTDIWEHVYGEESDTSSNVIDVYVGYLRKKLNSFGGENLLQTKRGHGYMLVRE